MRRSRPVSTLNKYIKFRLEYSQRNIIIRPSGSVEEQKLNLHQDYGNVTIRPMFVWCLFSWR